MWCCFLFVREFRARGVEMMEKFFFRIRSLQKQNLAKKKIIFDKIDKTHFTRFNLIIYFLLFFYFSKFFCRSKCYCVNNLITTEPELREIDKRCRWYHIDNNLISNEGTTTIFCYFKQWYNNHHAEQHHLSLLFLVVNEEGLCRQLDFHRGRGT